MQTCIMRSAQESWQKAAGVLGYREEQEKYQKLSEEQFAVVQEEYYSATGRCCIKTTDGAAADAEIPSVKEQELTKRQLLKLFEQSNHKLRRDLSEHHC